MTIEPGVIGAVVVVVVSAVAAVALVTSGRRRHLPVLAVVAAIALVVVATALPTRFSARGTGGTALALGHGGIGKAGLQLVRGNPGAAAELLVLNGLVYVPLGAALAWAWPGRRVLLVVPVVVSVAVETIQYLALPSRVAATDDVVVNVAGAALGWLAVSWWLRRDGATAEVEERSGSAPSVRR